MSLPAHILLYNGTVVTVDENMRVLDAGALLVVRDSIADIGDSDTLLNKYHQL